MFLVPQPKDFWQLGVLIGGFVLYYYIRMYEPQRLLGIPDWIIAVPIIIVGLYYFLKYEGVEIKLFKRKQLHGKRGV